MLERIDEIELFLTGSIWADWSRIPIAGDASSRRYYRLGSGEQTAILMDANPDTGESTARFADLATHLCGLGFAAPGIRKHDTDRGLLLLEDLGPKTFAQQIQTHPDQAQLLYESAADVLITLHKSTPPEGLSVMTPQIAADMLDTTEEWYLLQGNLDAVRDSVRIHLERFAGPPESLALRDFHVENLIWRPERTGSARVGLLDFQDAFLAPAGYDLVSLLRDARRSVDPNIATDMRDHFAKETAQDKARFLPAFHCLAVQRNLRILGIFSRLAIRDGKPRYLAFVSHVWSMIWEDLQHPELKGLKSACKGAIPPPVSSRLKDLL